MESVAATGAVSRRTDASAVSGTAVSVLAPRSGARIAGGGSSGAVRVTPDGGESLFTCGRGLFAKRTERTI
jgi:hypothetical protein